MDKDLCERKTERALACAVYCVDGIGSATLLPMYEDAGSMENLLKLLAKGECGLGKPVRGKSAPYLKRIGAEYAKNEESFIKRAENLYEKYLRAGIRFTFTGDADYPKKLKDIPMQPFGIFYRGKLPDESRPAVSIIGAREFYLNKGFDDYISKPIEVKYLEEILVKYLPKCIDHSADAKEY